MAQIAAIKEHMKEHMNVRGSDGALVGVVDHLEGEDTIKLIKNDSPDGRHHFIDAGLVERIDDEVHLSKPGAEIRSSWDPDGANVAS